VIFGGGKTTKRAERRCREPQEWYLLAKAFLDGVSGLIVSAPLPLADGTRENGGD
jgi:hypothetical protein